MKSASTARALVAISLIVACLVCVGCGPEGSPTAPASTPASASATATTVSIADQTEHLFLDATRAGLDGAEVITRDRGATGEITLCLGAGPFDNVMVTVPATYATRQQEVRRPGDGWLQQAAWVFPDAQSAAGVIRAIAGAIRKCTFKRTSIDPVEASGRVTTASSVARQSHAGWTGYSVDQVMTVNNQRTSVSTRLLLRHNRALLALEYCNYRGGSEKTLLTHNRAILAKILLPQPP